MTGQTPRLWTVLRCKEPGFQQFLGVDSEDAAAHQVKQRLQIKSRAELDRDAAAQARWNKEIRLPYLQHQQDPKNQSQDQEI